MARPCDIDFVATIGDADGGKLNRELSRELSKLVDKVTTFASEHDTEAKGSLSITLTVTCDTSGHVAIAPKLGTVKEPKEALPVGRFYYDPDRGTLTVEKPRQVKIPFPTGQDN